VLFRGELLPNFKFQAVNGYYVPVRPPGGLTQELFTYLWMSRTFPVNRISR